MNRFAAGSLAVALGASFACSACGPGSSATGGAAQAARGSGNGPEVQSIGGGPSIHAAVRRIRAHVDVPVIVPAPLPAGARIVHGPLTDTPGHAQLDLKLPHRGGLAIQYGRVGFDGCETPDFRRVSVGRGRGLLAVFRERRGPYRELIWPAARGGELADYGLSGFIPARRILTLAASMTPPGHAPREGKASAC